MKRLACACAVLLLAQPRAASAQDPPQESADALKRWVTAVRQHTPGRPDAAAGVVASLSYADRVRLNPAMQAFQRFLRTEPRNLPTKTLEDILALAREVKQDVGVAPFLRRAAILHTDAAIYREEFPAPPDDAPPPPSSQLRSTIQAPIRVPPPPPLLFNERQMRHLDGQVVGEADAEWNWPFARSLLDLMLARTAVAQKGDEQFVSDWYHAVAAYLFASGRHGDLHLHLQHAAEVLPDDPRMLFDRGCFAEMLGLAFYQSLHDDTSNRDTMTRLSIEVPDVGKTDAEAESLYRRALQFDPAYAEARVRLSRLLERRGRRDEAAGELDRALSGTSGTLDRVVLFYARLFAGRVALARGKATDGLAHYVAAAELFPDAQSALLGASQAAVIAGDQNAALSFMERLGPRSENVRSDPWWQYRLASGRDVSRLMTATYNEIK